MKRLVLIVGIVVGSGIGLAGCEDNPRGYSAGSQDAGKKDAGKPSAMAGTSGGMGGSSGGAGGSSADAGQ